MGYKVFRKCLIINQTLLFTAPHSMSKPAVIHSSRLRYSYLSLELPPCIHRMHGELPISLRNLKRFVFLTPLSPTKTMS